MAEILLGESFTESLLTYNDQGAFVDADSLPAVELRRNGAASGVNAAVTNLGDGAYSYTAKIPSGWSDTDTVEAYATAVIDGVSYTFSESLPFADVIDYGDGVRYVGGGLTADTDDCSPCRGGRPVITVGGRFDEIVTLKRDGDQFEIPDTASVYIALQDNRKDELIADSATGAGDPGADWGRSKVRVYLSSTDTSGVTFSGSGYIRIKVVQAVPGNDDVFYIPCVIDPC